MTFAFSPRPLHRGLLALTLLAVLPAMVAAQASDPTPRDRKSALGRYQVFHDFRYNDGGARSGALPSGDLVLGSDGSMYGTTSDTGGRKNRTDGSMYRVAPDGTVSTVLQFNAAIGTNPYSGNRPGYDGAIYGSLLENGPLGGGTLYRLHPVEGFSIIHAFDCNDPVIGCRPRGPAVPLPDGSIVGTTSDLTYKRAPDGTMTVLYPVALNVSVVGTDGNLYGASGDTTFRLSPQGQYTLLHTFDEASPEGTYTFSLILARDGNFYGTTYSGGPLRRGTAYRMTPEGAVTVVHAFSSGSYPSFSLQASDGFLYGTTTTNYSDDGGSVWRMALDGSGFRTVLKFSLEGGDAQGGSMNLVETPNGTLVSPSSGGGRFNAGTLFVLTPRTAAAR